MDILSLWPGLTMDKGPRCNRTPKPSDTHIIARAGGAGGCLPATLPTIVGGGFHLSASLLGFSYLGTPHSLPQPEGDSPKAPGGRGLRLLFFLQFSFQRKWNNSPGPCSPPSPPLPAFPAAPEPASCPCSSLCLPSPAACRGGKSWGWGGCLWERKEPGIAPPLLYSSPASLPESGWW